jgi:uncharacterized protein
MLLNDKIYGKIEITEPIVLELLKTPQMQRMKKIHQYGIFYYFHPTEDTTRFEHSLGVYLILKKFGAGIEEQLSGLLHDISHGVFSHVIDHLYGSTGEEDYQDSIHSTYFQNNEISAILNKHGFDPARISDLEMWSLMDNELPKICADRLQYTLGDAVTIGKISQAKAKSFVDSLIVKDNQLIFQNKEVAKEFAYLSLWMCQVFWHDNWGLYSFRWIATIMKNALKRSILDKNDIVSDDDSVIRKLEECDDKNIREEMHKLKSFRKEKVCESKSDYDFLVKESKMRVIDPFVVDGNKLVRVSELYPEFKNEFEKEKERVSRPRYLKLKD